MMGHYRCRSARGDKKDPWWRARLLVGWLLTLICRERRDKWTGIVSACDHTKKNVNETAALVEE